MIVKCKIKNIEEVDQNLQNRYENNDLICGSLDDLEVGREYKVICKEETTGGYTYIYLPEVTAPYTYPSPYPIDLFEVIDGQLPKYWKQHETLDHNGKVKLRNSFPEWAKDDMFYENLLEENPEALEIYKTQLTTIGL